MERRKNLPTRTVSIEKGHRHRTVGPELIALDLRGRKHVYRARADALCAEVITLGSEERERGQRCWPIEPGKKIRVWLSVKSPIQKRSCFGLESYAERVLLGTFVVNFSSGTQVDELAIEEQAGLPAGDGSMEEPGSGALAQEQERLDYAGLSHPIETGEQRSRRQRDPLRREALESSEIEAF
jgi:hypothetical protein